MAVEFNLDEAKKAFSDELRAMGLIEADPVMDGRFHRCPVDDARKGKLDGAYVGYLDGRPAGYIENHRTGERTTWRFGAEAASISEAERAARSREIAELSAAREAERQLERVATAAKAAEIWSKLPTGPHPDRGCPYLERKGVAADGLRFSSDGSAYVPLRDASGTLWNLQRIAPDGSKTFLKGGRKSDCFHVLGEIGDGRPFLVAEGYSTAATVRELTGLPVAVAFDAGNIRGVAAALTARNPRSFCCVMADDDRFNPKNPGMTKARAAAAEFCLGVASPSFPEGDRGTDWNDMAASRGRDVARAAALEGIERGREAARQAALAVASEIAGEPLVVGKPLTPGPARFATPIAFGAGLVILREGRNGALPVEASRFAETPKRFQRQRLAVSKDGSVACSPVAAREREAARAM